MTGELLHRVVPFADDAVHVDPEHGVGFGRLPRSRKTIRCAFENVLQVALAFRLMNAQFYLVGSLIFVCGCFSRRGRSMNRPALVIQPDFRLEIVELAQFSCPEIILDA